MYSYVYPCVTRMINTVWKHISVRGRGARWKVGGLTIENNFFILKIEKRNKIIVFDFQKVGAGAQKSGGAAALPAPPPPRSLSVLQKFDFVYISYVGTKMCMYSYVCYSYVFVCNSYVSVC